MVVDPNPVNNRYPQKGQLLATFQVGQRVEHPIHNSEFTSPRGRVSRWRLGRDARQRIAFLRSLYPANPRLIVYEPFRVLPVFEFGNDDGKGQIEDNLLNELNNLLDKNPGADRLFAWIPDGCYAAHGNSDPVWNYGTGRVAFGCDSGNMLTSRWPDIWHENGHLTNPGELRHTDRRLQINEYGYDVQNVDPFRRVVMRLFPRRPGRQQVPVRSDEGG